MSQVSFASKFLEESANVLSAIDTQSIESTAQLLSAVRDAGGRLFILGVGGSAGHASHAVNDFRKICAFEAYTPTDNVSELTARINDDGWDTSLAAWLKGSRISAKDGILVFSVGGGNKANGVSINLIRAMDLARSVGAKIAAVVGRDGGYAAQIADACIIIPPLYSARVTPHTEGLCAVVWHLLVSHPTLQINTTKWEGVDRP